MQVKTFWAHSRNLGDALAPYIIKNILQLEPKLVERNVEGKLLVIGSVDWAIRAQDVLLGIGRIGRGARPLPKGVQILALRGPLTKKTLGINQEIPDVFGDPALLVPKFYQPRPRPRSPYGVIPHMVDYHLVKDRMTQEGVKIINICQQDPLATIDEIASCDIVFSSSLHGIILAEAYGSRAAWVQFSNLVVGRGFKFNDYFLSTGRPIRRPLVWKQEYFQQNLKTFEDMILPEPRIDLKPLEEAFANFRRDLEDRYPHLIYQS